MLVEENLRAWDSSYKWPDQGDEWSARWGGPRLQWFVGMLPRIQKFLPADTILEIAPGRGRWTQFLHTQCRRLILVDLSPSCIESCKRRFSGSSDIEYHVNDGRSLEMLEDESIDFVFSYDSLVHAEPEVMQAYVQQLGRKLRLNGAGFIHHSNGGNYSKTLIFGRLVQKLPVICRCRFLFDHMRSLRMTAELMRSYCQESHLLCLSQEIIPWERTLLPIDCLTTFMRPKKDEIKSARIVKNMRYMEEAKTAKLLSDLY